MSRPTIATALRGLVACGCAVGFAVAALLARPAGAETGYVDIQVSGWKLKVARSLLSGEPILAEQALQALGRQLADLRLKLPPRRLLELRTQVIRLEHNRVQDIAYRADDLPLDAIERPTGDIEIGDARYYLGLAGSRPARLLGELARAYHHQVLGYDNREVRLAFEQARDGGLLNDLRTRSPSAAYRVLDDRQYFADLTEGYMGGPSTLPFDPAELAAHDPAGIKMLRTAWERTPSIDEVRLWGAEADCRATPPAPVGPPGRVVFINATNEMLVVEWTDARGTAHLLAEVAASATRVVQGAPRNQRFRVRTSGGICRGTFTLRDGAMRVVAEGPDRPGP